MLDELLTSLRARIAVAMSAAFLLFVAAAAFATLRYFEGIHRATVAAGQYALVAAAAAGVDSQLDQLHAVVRSAARVVPESALADPEQAQEFLQTRTFLRRQFESGLLLVGADGRLVAQSGPLDAPVDRSGRGADLSDRPYVRAGLATGQAGVFALPRGDGVDAPGLAMTAPLHDTTGATVGLLIGVTRLTGRERFAGFPEIASGERGHLFLLDRDHTVLMHAAAREAAAGSAPAAAVIPALQTTSGFEGSVDAVSLTGEPILLSVKRLQRADWALAGVYPMAALDAPVAAARPAFVLIVVAGTALLLATAWWMLGRLTAPLARITSHVETLGTRQGEQRRLPAGRADEVGRLALAFNRMLTQLDARDAELRAREAQLRLVTDNVPALIAFYDGDLVCRFANRHYARLHGMEPRSAVGMHLQNIVGPEIAAQVRQRLRDMDDGAAARYDGWRRGADGVARLFEIALIPAADGGGFYVMMVDVSERRQAEQALQDSRERLRSLLELSSDWYWEQDSAYRFVPTPREIEQRDAERAPDFVGRTRWEIAPDGLPPERWAAHRAQLDRREEFRDLEYCRPGADGQMRWVSVSGRPIFDVEGRFAGYRGVGRDITLRKAAEEALRQSQLKFAGAFQASPDAITICRLPDGVLLEANDAFEQATGHPPAQAIGLTMRDLGLWPLHHQWTELLRAIADGRPVRDFAFTLATRDGARRDCQLNASVFEAGGERCMVAVVRDVTEIRQAQLQLRTILEQLPIGLWVADRHGAITLFEGAALGRLATGAETALGRSAQDVFRCAPQVVAAIELGLRGQAQRCSAAAGDAVFDALIVPRHDAAGQPDGLLGVAVDVTERQRTEAALRHSEALLNQAQRAARLGNWDLDLVSGEAQWSDEEYRLLGYEPRSVAASAASFMAAVHPDDRAAVEAAMRRAQDPEAGEVAVVHRVLGAGGTCRYLQQRGRVSFDGQGRPLRMFGTTLDITERQRSEDALRDSEARFAAMFNESPVALALIRHADGRYLDANQAYLQMFGFTREALIGTTPVDAGLYVDPGDRPALLAALAQSGAVRAYPLRLRRTGGEARHCEVSGRRIRLGADELVLWAVTDVTEQRQAEHALRNTMTRLQTVILGAPIALFAFDRDGRFTLTEGRGLQALGLAPGDGVGRPVLEVFRDAPDMLTELQQALNGETRSGRVRLGDRTFALYLRPLNPPGTPYRGSVGVLLDVSEQARAEEALRQLNERLELRVQQRTAELARAGEELMQSEKLAALGRLVAGVAHELNTPIGNSLLVTTALSESARELKAALDTGLRRSQLDGYVDAALRSAALLERNLTRAADLIASFKQVAVDQASAQRRRFDLAAIVHENVTTLSPSLRGLPVTIACEVPAGLQMEGYPGPLGQVLTNLINNAVVHAFDEGAGGTIRIQAAAEGDDTVALAVIDDGRGIAAEHLRRIFDPFFTTKLGRGGSGLGLNIVHNLVTGVLGGRIEAISEPGSGTRFDITLPRCAPLPAATVEV